MLNSYSFASKCILMKREYEEKMLSENNQTFDFIQPIKSKQINITRIIEHDMDILNASSVEKKLLAKAGLTIENTDDVRVIKDKKGNLKSALALSKDNFGNINKIHYVDADDEDKHFKRAIIKFSCAPEGVLIHKQKVEIIKEELNPFVIVKD